MHRKILYLPGKVVIGAYNFASQADAGEGSGWDITPQRQYRSTDATATKPTEVCANGVQLPGERARKRVDRGEGDQRSSASSTVAGAEGRGGATETVSSAPKDDRDRLGSQSRPLGAPSSKVVERCHAGCYPTSTGVAGPISTCALQQLVRRAAYAVRP